MSLRERKGLMALPHLWWNVQIIILALSCGDSAYHFPVTSFFLHIFPFSWSSILSTHLLLRCSLSIAGMIQIFLLGPSISLSLIPSIWVRCVIALATAHRSNKLPWWILGITQTYMYTHGYLVRSLTIWPFSKSAEVFWVWVWNYGEIPGGCKWLKLITMWIIH